MVVSVLVLISLVGSTAKYSLFLDCEFERCSGCLGCNVLKISIKSNCPIVSLRIFAVSIFLKDLSTDVRGVLKLLLLLRLLLLTLEVC